MKTLKQIRKEHITQVIERTGWDIKKASRLLRVSESFLEKEIHKLGISGKKAKLKKSFKK